MPEPDSADAAAFSRPKLTLTPAAGQRLAKLYGSASVILEYGSGGSTVLAAEMPGKTIFSVESDKAWSAGLAAYLARHPETRSMPLLHHVDIGETGAWGHPTSPAGWRQFHAYPLSVWTLPEFRQPDVVLVDGRFRVACFLATLFSTTRPVTLLFDDYRDRSAYHWIERFAEPVAYEDRMAVFHVTPQAVPPEALLPIVGAFAQPA